MKKKILSFLPYFFIIILSLYLLKDLLKVGFPYTHDGHSHLARLANLWLTLKSGQFPPRFAPNLDYNFGYPVFNFNYYFSYFFALVFRVFKFSFETSLKTNIIIFYTLGGLGVYSWTKKYTKNSIAFLTSVIYLTFPYQLLNIFIRGNIGESAALGVLPWVLLSIDKITKKYKSQVITSLITAFFWLMHNLVTLLGLPIIALYFIVTKIKPFGLKNLAKTGLTIFSLSTALVAFFYLPALQEKKFITLDKLSLNTQYYQHFVFPTQLLKDNFQFGYSMEGDQDTMPLTLGIPPLILLLSSLALFTISKSKQNKSLYIFFISTTAISTFMTLPYSHFIYKLIPPLTYLQFPWRWFLVTNITLPISIGLALSNFKSKKLTLALTLVTSVILVIYVSPWTKITNSIHHSNQDYHDFFFTSSVLHENTSIWFDRNKNLEIPTQYAFERNNNVQPQISIWDAKEHLYIMNYDQPMNVIERTAYFPGWKVYVDNQEIDINYQDQQFPGTISFNLPAGEHHIKTIFTQQTPPRIIGNSLSFLALLGSLIYLLLAKKLK